MNDWYVYLTCLLIALYLAIRGTVRFLKVVKCAGEGADWVATEAKVLNSSDVSSRIMERKHVFQAIYEIDGIKYGCEKISFYPPGSFSDGVLVSRAEPGEVVTIYHDSDKPENSVYLNPRDHRFFRLSLQMVFGWIILFSISIFWLSLI